MLTLSKFKRKGAAAMSELCYYEGKFMPASECRIPVTDMLIQRGVGTFESVRIYDGKLMGLTPHLERFANSVKSAGIDLEALGGIKKIEEIIRLGVARDDCPKNGMVKPYATGGDINEPKGVFPKPRFFAIFAPVLAAKTQDEIENGAALLPNKMLRPNPLVKSINYLFGLIPLGQSDHSYFESVYVTPQGEFTEGMTSNFYLVKGGKIITAPVGKVLKGVTREIILTLARENGFEVEERCPLEGELAEASEAFITGSIKEVLSIVRVGDVKIGDGRPGVVAKKIQELYTQNRSRWLE